ncbi:CotH kinase family protein [candidate division KSB1 bacterium]|nr:CotH kinase family protein [candidate division KSB1 bacterium]
MRYAKFILLFLILMIQQLPAKIYINEFMAANKKVFADEAGEYDDWIELYNDSTAAISLSGYYLTDNLNSPQKWAFAENYTIPAHGFLLIWADDGSVPGTLHANFKLDADGEQLGLFDGFRFIDSLSFGNQAQDISCGRFPDGADSWLSLAMATPGSNNVKKFVTAETPRFSLPGGFHKGTISVELQVTSPTAKIYYTLDSSEPSPASKPYITPLLLNKTTVIRARAFENGLSPGEIITNTYIFYTDLQIGSISLVTAPSNLYDSKTGIYANPEERGDEWERPVAVEFFDESGKSLNAINAGLRIHGVNSRLYNKKPFRLYFRSEYGENTLNRSIFNSKSNIDEYKRLVLLSGASDMVEFPGGYEWTLVRTAIGHRIFQKMGGNFLGNRPVAVFLNGNRWGIYQLTERVDKYFIESNFNEADADIIETFWFDWYAQEGDLNAWNRFYQFAEENDLADANNYKQMQQMMDIENFADYHILEIYLGNADWPFNNIYTFRPRRDDAKWRWILWDIDRSLGYIGPWNNTLESATKSDKMTTLLRKLLDNPAFRNLFVNRFADQLNTNFLTGNVKSIMDSMAALIRTDITFETNQWGSSPAIWESNLKNRLKQFVELRPDYLWRHLKAKFSLTDPVKVTVDIPRGGKGRVRINTIQLSRFPWSGSYFNEIPVEIEAIPVTGYRFASWHPEYLPQNSKIKINLTDNIQIYPVFERYEQAPVVINEINYHSAADFNVEDWIELHNFSDKAIDISGWHLKDADDTHDFQFPENLFIKAEGFLVISQDSSRFRQLFPFVRPIIGNFNFGLDNKGELLRLSDRSFNQVDSVHYDDEAPWPLEPDGTGATLALINPSNDNMEVQNWKASASHGTPGLPNSSEIAPFIYLSSDKLTFSGIIGWENPPAQKVIVQNSGPGEIFWTAMEIPDSPWLTFSPPQGNAGDTVEITVDIAGLDAGTYSAFIRFGDLTAAVDSAHLLVQLNLTPGLPPTILAEFEAESSVSLPNAGWQVVENNGATGVLALENSLNEPRAIYQLDYSFDVPADETAVYVFAEVDINNNQNDDSFWISMNSQETCLWRDLIALGDGWKRSWIFNYKKNTKHAFRVNPGLNVLNVFPREDGPFINWLVVTTNPDLDIQNYQPEMFTKKFNPDKIEPDQPIFPALFSLNQNFPNPFNPAASISFAIPKECEVILTVYNSLGQVVRQLLNQRMAAGYHRITWDGMDSVGQSVQSGIYFCEMRTAEFQQVIKMVRIR